MSRVEELIGQLVRAAQEEALLESGKSLKDFRWEDIENPACALGAKVERALATQLAESQAELATADCCPCCHEPLIEKPPQARRIQTLAGLVVWKQPVFRCTRCRRDFFPSGPLAGPGAGRDAQPGGSTRSHGDVRPRPIV